MKLMSKIKCRMVMIIQYPTILQDEKTVVLPRPALSKCLLHKHNLPRFGHSRPIVPAVKPQAFQAIWSLRKRGRLLQSKRFDRGHNAQIMQKTGHARHFVP
jgi:hypothetical protein